MGSEMCIRDRNGRLALGGGSYRNRTGAGYQPGQKGFQPVDDLIARQVDMVSAGTRFLERIEYLQRHCVFLLVKDDDVARCASAERHTTDVG